MILTFQLNGQKKDFLVQPTQTLLEVLREKAQLSGTKCGCNTGECGICTVLVDGVPTLSCITLAVLCQDKEIITIEGLQGQVYQVLRQAFLDEGAVQCGFCTPSIVLVLWWILEREPREKARDIHYVKQVLSGHLCRCTGYVKILKAYEQAIKKLYP